MHSKSNNLSFAKDITLYVSNPNLDTPYDIANKEINKLYNWFDANKLSLNAKTKTTTKYLLLRTKHKSCSFVNKSLLINGIPTNKIGNDCTDSSVKFLGISVVEHLTDS